MYIFKVTYKEYIDGKKYKNEVDIVASDFIEAAEKVKTVLNRTGKDYTICLVKYINDFYL